MPESPRENGSTRISTPGRVGAPRRRARVAVGVLAAALVVLCAVAPVSATAASAAPVDTIYSLVNQARAAAGLRGLLHNESMDAVAAAWANQMGAAGALSHNPQFSAQIPAGWSRAGENVGEGYPTPQAMFDGWMRSPGHRANILGDYTDIGIAFVTLNGRTWGVQDFGKYPGHVGPAVPQSAAPPPAPRSAPPPVAGPAPAATAAPPPNPSASPSPLPSPLSSSMPDATPSASSKAGGERGGQAEAGPMEDGVLGSLLVSVAMVVVAVGLTVVLWRRRNRNSTRDRRQL